MSRVLTINEIAETAIISWPALRDDEKASFLLVVEAQRDLSDRETAQELFEKIEATGVLRGHRYIVEGDIRQSEEHYPDRCGLCSYLALKAKYPAPLKERG